MTIAYHHNVDTFSAVTNRSNVVQYRHWFDYKACEWKHTVDYVLAFTYEHKTYTYKDDDIHDIKLTGCDHVNFWYYPDFDQNRAEERCIDVTKYEHYFDEEKKCGVHKFTQTDGTVITFWEECIGTLVITSADF